MSHNNNRVAVHILADPAASSWLQLSSPEEGAEGFPLQLDSYEPIDTQLTQQVANRGAAPPNQMQQPPPPPPSTLGIIMFRNDAAAAEYLKKRNSNLQNKSNNSLPILPRPRSLGLDSMLLFSDSLLPGVDHTAATCSSTGDLIAFVNASGLEASPFQLIHSGVNIVELGTVAGQAVSNGSFSSNPLGSARGPVDNNDENDENENDQQEEGADGNNNNNKSARSTKNEPALPAVPAGRLVLLVVGDLLSYCSKDILQMVAQMSRPFRSLAPAVIDNQLLAYCAQDACLVGSKVLVARDGCAVWRPQGETTAQGRRRAASVVHSSQNRDVEKYMPDPLWDGGAAVFVNHPIGPAWFDRSKSALGNSRSSSEMLLASPVFRRVLRVTWTDAFLGSEHGGPEARRRFSAPTVAIGVIHASQVHQATKVSESGVITGGHVFGNVKESVMWCMSPDAALFPGPHLQPVRGPCLQCSPHVYVQTPKPSLVRSTSGQQQQARSMSDNNNNNNSKSPSVTNQQNSSSSSELMNPTVLTTTVTIFVDTNMNCLTIMNNNRRVASWDLSEIWALNGKAGGNKKGKKKKHQQQQNADSNNASDDATTETESTATADTAQQEGNGENSGSSGGVDRTFASVFYPVVDLGFPGTIVEVIN